MSGSGFPSSLDFATLKSSIPSIIETTSFPLTNLPNIVWWELLRAGKASKVTKNYEPVLPSLLEEAAKR